jgi:hypothetical protein
VLAPEFGGVCCGPAHCGGYNVRCDLVGRVKYRQSRGRMRGEEKRRKESFSGYYLYSAAAGMRDYETTAQLLLSALANCPGLVSTSPHSSCDARSAHASHK